MSSFTLEIYTPTRTFFSGKVESLVMPILDGSYGVEAGHEPVTTAIEPGELRYKTEGTWHVAAITRGFAEIKPDRTILLVSAAEHPEEIDLRRAEAAKERAQERLRQKASIQEYYSAQAALTRAMARLKTVQDKRR
ncbi:MAG: F0F1 ATP synthase subunit epsilon [Lawsonibacter sp.]